MSQPLKFSKIATQVWNAKAGKNPSGSALAEGLLFLFENSQLFDDEKTQLIILVPDYVYSEMEAEDVKENYEFGLITHNEMVNQLVDAWVNFISKNYPDWNVGCHLSPDELDKHGVYKYVYIWTHDGDSQEIWIYNSWEFDVNSLPAGYIATNVKPFCTDENCAIMDNAIC